MHKQQESALMSFVLFNISNEIMTRENAGVAYQEGSNRVCIIFTGCRSREFGDKIHSICQEIQQKVKEVIGIETSIGIGSWVRSPQELVYSYKLAEKAIGYRYLLGGSLLLDMEEKKTDNSINLIKSLETLTEEIKVGNRQKVTEILEQIEHEIKGALVEKSYACIYLQQVIRAIGNTCQSLSDDPEKIIAQREKLLKEVSLFDVYEGKNLEAGKKSYAVSFLLQDESQTLNDKMIDKIMSKLVKNLEDKLGAKLR
jgi:two-component system response regulator YesN